MNFQLNVARVHENLFAGEAESITLPGTNGEFTVLAGHEPFITTLKEGTAIIRAGGEEGRIDIHPGVVEVTPTHTTVLL